MSSSLEDQTSRLSLASDIKTFPIPNFQLQSGATLPSTAWIAYKTFGSPSLPVVLYPTWFSGLIADNEWLIGSHLALSPAKYFIIIPALIGNGESISPSNTNPHDNKTVPEDEQDKVNPFPDVTFYDNVRAQHKLVTKGLGVKHLRMVLGWSMGAAQTFQWATQYPDMMDVCAPFCGSARTSLHNQVFLEGVKSALLAGKGLRSAGSAKGRVEEEEKEEEVSLEQKKKQGNRKWTAEEREVGLKAFGRGYAGWGFSQAFYRERLHESAYGAKDLEDFMVTFWEGWALSKDPENLLVMLHTWQAGDVSLQEPYRGNFEAAMGAIKARMLVLPCKTDLYFPPEDSEYEVKNMSSGVGTLEVYPSIWGHWAGGPPGNMDDVKWLDERLAKMLNDTPVP